MINVGDSWAVKRPDNYVQNDDWVRLISFLNAERPSNYSDYKGESDQYYGIDKRGIGFSSPNIEDFGREVKLSEATEFILSNHGYIGASGFSFEDEDVHIPQYEYGKGDH